MGTDELITLLARRPEALPPRHPRRDWWIASVLGMGGALGLMLVLLGPRADVADALGQPLFLQKLCALALLAILSGWAAYRAGVPGRELRTPLRSRWLVPLWLAIATGATLLSAPAGERLALFHSPTILQCLVLVGVLALPPVVALAWALRRAAPTDLPLASNALGWAAGAMGAFAYAFHCEADQPGYVLVWYGLAIAWFVALTRAVGARWLRW
jgi:hypothetical protein